MCDLLDIMFNQSDDVLVEKDENLGKIIQNSDIFPLPELTFSDDFSFELFDGLNEIDFSSVFPDPIGDMSPTTELSTPSICNLHAPHESYHQYNRPSFDFTIEGQTIDPAELSIGFGYNSNSLFSASNSPTGTSSGISDDLTLSPAFTVQSPLGGNMEYSDLMNGFDPISFLLKENGLNHSINDREEHENRILSLGITTAAVSEMYATDADSSSDVGVGNIFTTFMDSSSTFECSRRTTPKKGGFPSTVHTANIDTYADDQSQLDVRLSEEERHLLTLEGIELPNDFLLTKEEERALKAVRRKIRNKLSAKVSRRRKQDYIEGLETRVKKCTIQNRQLQEKVGKLEKQNTSLITQLKQLQAFLVPRGVTDSLMTMKNTLMRKQTQTGTCIMVLVLSFALFLLPSLNPLFDPIKPENSKSVGPGRSRNLLEQAENQPFSAIEKTRLFMAKFDRIDEDLNYTNVPYPFQSNPDIPTSKKSTVDISDTSVSEYNTMYGQTVADNIKEPVDISNDVEPVDDNYLNKSIMVDFDEILMKVKNMEPFFVSGIDEEEKNERDLDRKTTRNEL